MGGREKKEERESGTTIQKGGERNGSGGAKAKGERGRKGLYARGEERKAHSTAVVSIPADLSLLFFPLDPSRFLHEEAPSAIRVHGTRLLVSSSSSSRRAKK